MPNQLILPDGRPTTDDEVNETERKRERSSEDEKYFRSSLSGLPRSAPSPRHA